ncbi:MAG: flagellar hook protein FlgE, partial [Betaproteobacteria bacterium]|nr:flagellar hook protein FlgE [Betaproteobacteria bacterium]
MSSGFSIGLNALQANSGAIEVASKNIAASNVSGYKASEYLFQEALTRSLQPSSSGRFGSTGTGGVTRRSYAAGSSKYSASPLDMSINGDGMYVVGLFKEPSPEKTYFTRSGNFLTDKEGNIVSSSGLYLYGYQPNSDASNVTDVIGPLKEPASPMPPNRTSNAFLSVNLDARTSIVSSEVPRGELRLKNILNTDDPTTYSHIQQFPLYDKLGRQHSVTMYFRRVEPKIYDVYVNVDGQIFAPNDDLSNKELRAEIKVQMPDSKSTIPESEADSTTTTGKTGPSPIARFGFSEGRLVKIGGAGMTTADLAGLGPNDAAGLSMQFSLIPPAPENPLDIKDPDLLLSDEITFKLDFSGTTNFASAFEVKRNEQDGYAAGSLTGLSVDDKGILRGQFTNGRTLVAGAIQLATFKGLGGLREVSNNTYEATPQSGDPIYGRAADGIFGSVRSNSVEEANTDMAGELVRLMVQQRNYQANAQSIRTQVEILSVTI